VGRGRPTATTGGGFDLGDLRYVVGDPARFKWASERHHTQGWNASLLRHAKYVDPGLNTFVYAGLLASRGEDVCLFCAVGQCNNLYIGVATLFPPNCR